MGLAAGPSSGLPLASANADGQSGGGKDGRNIGWSSSDPTRRRTSGPIANDGILSREKAPLTNDLTGSKDAMLSSSNFFRSSGSARRGAMLSSRNAAVGSETEPSSRPLTLDSSLGAVRKSSGAQRSSHIMSSEHNRVSSGRNTSNINNLDSTLRGIESLHLNDERAQY